MALDRLTKIDGGGISTTSDYRVGVITATKFVGPIDGVVTGSLTGTATTAVNAQGLIGTPDITVRNIKATGLSTFVGDAQFDGNVSIAGTLTYEDVTNIDSVGLITARDGIFIPNNEKLEFSGSVGSSKIRIYQHAALGSMIEFTSSSTGYIGHNASGAGKSLVLNTGNDFVFKGLQSNGAQVDIARFYKTGQRCALNADGVEKFTTSSKGIQVGTGVTIETNGQATYTGIVTATSFVGSGANLTSLPAQITFSNPSNNRILTSEGGIGVNCESTLNYGNNQLTFSGSATPLSGTSIPYSVNIYRDGGSGYGYFDTMTNSSYSTGVRIRTYDNTIYNNVIEHTTSNVTNFQTNGSTRLSIDSNGRVIIGKVMTAGSGSHYDDITINNSNQSGTAGSTGIDLISSNDAYGGLIFSDEDADEQGYIKYWHNSDSDKMRFGTNSNDRWEISKDGHWIPASDSSYDIGTNATRVRYLYTDNFYATSLSYDGNTLKLGGGSRALSNGYYDDIVIDNSDTTSGEAGGVGISLIAGNQSWMGLIFGDNDEHQRGYIKYSHENDFMQFVAASGQVRIMSNGTVNIGGDFDQTTYNLSVTHSSNFLRLKDSNEGNYDLRFMIQNSEANIWHYGTDDFVFGNRYDRKLHFITNGQKRFTIHGNNIGINDTTPSYTLNVIGDNAASNGIGMLKGIIGVQNDTTAYGSSPTAGISFQTKYRTGPDVPLDVAAIWGGKENTTNGDKDGYMGFATREEGGSGTQERMRITSDGKILTPLGTTTRIGVADRTSGTGAGGSLCVTAGAARGSGQTSGDLLLATGRGNNSASPGTIKFGYNNGADGTSLDQEWLSISSSGHLVTGGSTAPNQAANDGSLFLKNDATLGFLSQGGSLTFNAYYNGGWKYYTTGDAHILWGSGDGINLSMAGSGTANNAVSFSRAFQVTTTKAFHFGSQTSLGKYGDNVQGCSWYDEKNSWQQGQSGGIGWSMWYLNKIGGTSTDNRMIQFNSSGSAIGYISRSGSNIVYQTSSDYRLKKDVVALPNSIDRVKQLRPVAFKWIEDNSDMEGFLAHEAQEVVPYAVSGKKDEVATEDFGDRKKGDMIVQAIDYGEFTPLLTAAMKELIAKVETLEAEVAALKGS